MSPKVANRKRPTRSTLLPRDVAYPESVKAVIKSAPLYMFGNVNLLGRRAIGICGSRDASPSALRWAHRFGSEAVKHDLVVVSGYARGVDREAHRGALEAGGATIAVLAEGIEHFRLVSDLRKLVDFDTNFLAISMFEPDEKWQVWRAMSRNRLIVGLSVGVFVIEARQTGGTIEAAREAVRQGKRLWAIAYTENSLGREGNRLLIGESAVPLKGTADLRRALEQASVDPPSDIHQLMLGLVHDSDAT